MDSTKGIKRGVKTTHTVFEIVELINELDGATLAELSNNMDFAKSTLHDHLRTLEEKEYVVQRDGEYLLGLKFLNHGMFAKKERAVTQPGQEIINQLADKTSEAVWIIVEEHGSAVYLCNANGNNSIRTHAEVGRRSRLHHLAAGKQILAHLPEERVDEIIQRHGLPKLTENTITDPDELKVELEKVRDQQVSYNDQETVNGIRAIAAPVLNGGEFVCAICVSGPANRLTFDRCENDIKPKLLEATNELELRLQYPDS